MNRNCPYCETSYQNISKFGHFIRKSDGKKFQRFQCQHCLKTFSTASFQLNFRQRKRHLHSLIRKDICSGVSQRRIAKKLKLSRTTVARKLQHLALQAYIKNQWHQRNRSAVTHFQFDDLETFEHTKCKPLSITMAVETDTRKILGFRVSRIPAKGHLAKIARKKYGFRPDDRAKQRDHLFKELHKIVDPICKISSDEHPHYPKTVKKWFPKACHKTTKGRRGCVTGQGEMKAGGFDPLFSLNHTYAMVRCNLKRMSRRTWCTTKTIKGLQNQLEIYMHYHNAVLTPALKI